MIPAPAPLLDLVGADRASTPQVWASRVERTPDGAFLHFEDRTWTYTETWQLIDKVAGFFARHSAGRATRIGSYLSNRPEALWVWFGAHRACAVYVALNRSHKGALLEEMLREARLSVLVTDFSGLAELSGLQSHGIPTIVLVESAGDPPPRQRVQQPDTEVVGFAELLTGAAYDGPLPAPGDLATLMYTSGTTGRSKAARQPHNMFCRGAARFVEAAGLTAADVVHTWFPLFHVAGQLHMTMGTVIAGGSLSLQRTFSASHFWQQVNADRCTFFGALPNVISILLRQPPGPQDTRHTLRTGVVGPQPPREARQAFEQRFGVRLLDTYGMTEAEPLTLPSRDGNAPWGSCGRANPDFELAVMDDAGRVLGAGETGELVVRPREPDLMMRAYEARPEETLKAFTGLWFHTGDLAEIDDDGFVYIVGRIKHMIRRRGENVSAWELEQIISRHPAIDECAAVGIPSPLGEEDIKAVVTLRAGKDLSHAELHDYCVANMAKFMVPRYIEIREALPRTDVGKIHKPSLTPNDGRTWDVEQPTQDVDRRRTRADRQVEHR